MNEASNLKDHKVAACTDQDVSGKQLGELNRDVIFNEVREVNESENASVL